MERIVKDYNIGAINIEQYFQRLSKLINDLQEEEKRHIKDGLTEEELAIFDILTKPRTELTKKKEQQAKTLAQELLEILKEQKLVLDWKKRTRTRADIQITIEDSLWERLPEPPYTQGMKKEKSMLVYQHVCDSYFRAGLSVYAEVLG